MVYQSFWTWLRRRSAHITGVETNTNQEFLCLVRARLSKTITVKGHYEGTHYEEGWNDQHHR